MAINVNPPPQIKLPPELAKDRATRTYFQHLDRMLLQLWKRTGGADDLIDASAITEVYPWPIVDSGSENNSETSKYYQQAVSTDRQVFNSTTKTINYTANDFDFINAKANVQITFPQYPCEDSVIIIRNGDSSSIKLYGNGKNINGCSTGQLEMEGTAIEFYYFLDSDEWFAK